jgi:hypothetical protein
MEYLSKLHSQAADASAAEASHRADFNASRPTSDSVLGNVVGAGVHGYAFGRIFGHATVGGLYGALNGLESSIRQIGTAMNAASQATLAAQRHLELLDECLVGFFVHLDRNAEKLFDWAGSNTFGASLDLSAVHSIAKEANELLGEAVIPILNKLSIVSAVTEVQDEQAKLQAKLQQEQEKQEQEKKKREQEENEARSWVDKQVRSCAGKNPSKGQLAFVKVTLLLSIVVGIIGLIVAIVSQSASNAAPEPASIQAPMATPEPTRSEVERIPMLRLRILAKGCCSKVRALLTRLKRFSRTSPAMCASG